MVSQSQVSSLLQLPMMLIPGTDDKAEDTWLLCGYRRASSGSQSDLIRISSPAPHSRLTVFT